MRQFPFFHTSFPFQFHGDFGKKISSTSALISDISAALQSQLRSNLSRMAFTVSTFTQIFCFFIRSNQHFTISGSLVISFSFSLSMTSVARFPSSAHILIENWVIRKCCCISSLRLSGSSQIFTALSSIFCALAT